METEVRLPNGKTVSAKGEGEEARLLVDGEPCSDVKGSYNVETVLGWLEWGRLPYPRCLGCGSQMSMAPSGGDIPSPDEARMVAATDYWVCGKSSCPFTGRGEAPIDPRCAWALMHGHTDPFGAAASLRVPNLGR